MWSNLRDAWKIPEIRKKLLFTLATVFIFRIGSAIPVPYMNQEAIQQLFNNSQGTMLDFLDMMAGGNISQFSVFATSIYPYITASIVIQLLTYAIPSLEELAKDEDGRKKIQIYTRYLGIALAFVTAIGYTFGLFGSALEATTLMQKMIVVLSIVGGTAFLIWLSDQITMYGISNGSSIIIFLGIIGKLPGDIRKMIYGVKIGYISILSVVLFTIFALFVVVIVVAINEGERRIPVQYAKRVVGRKLYGGQATHIPIKVSMSGVMPIIFANAIMSIPGLLSIFNPEGGFARFFTNWFTTQTVKGTVIYTILNIVLIIAFAFFYSSMQFNTVEYSKNLQQQGGFIPGIRPGKPTSVYLQRILDRVVIVGAIVLAFLATIPTFVSIFTKIPIAFGGTSLIIVVGVVIEIVKSIEQQMLIRHYKGFLN
ncbi:preprotein translocase subunit SecY [Neofamilia massiliensis]|uniref:preprotein translocase subunit SecY n=1 Tax=Neofamilia massiliensis TaxID=1673724 RepID=UPI0006BB9327|nr:preprotein translocase subunit SecY [Neofamilia massiliensis]